MDSPSASENLPEKGQDRANDHESPKKGETRSSRPVPGRLVINKRQFKKGRKKPAKKR